MYTEKDSFWICKLIFSAPHAYLLLPYSPQILQGHCPLVLPPSEIIWIFQIKYSAKKMRAAFPAFDGGWVGRNRDPEERPPPLSPFRYSATQQDSTWDMHVVEWSMFLPAAKPSRSSTCTFNLLLLRWFVKKKTKVATLTSSNLWKWFHMVTKGHIFQI